MQCVSARKEGGTRVPISGEATGRPVGTESGKWKMENGKC
jgi:hypothetical protein